MREMVHIKSGQTDWLAGCVGYEDQEILYVRLGGILVMIVWVATCCTKSTPRCLCLFIFICAAGRMRSGKRPTNTGEERTTYYHYMHIVLYCTLCKLEYAWDRRRKSIYSTSYSHYNVTCNRNHTQGTSHIEKRNKICPFPLSLRVWYAPQNVSSWVRLAPPPPPPSFPKK